MPVLQVLLIYGLASLESKVASVIFTPKFYQFPFTSLMYYHYVMFLQVSLSVSGLGGFDFYSPILMPGPERERERDC